MRKPLKALLAIIGIPLLYGLIIRLFSDTDLSEVMSISFLLLLPTAMGAITMFVAHLMAPGQTLVDAVFKPWLSVVALLIVTIVTMLEGWACWVMIAIPFFPCASVGGIVMWWLLKSKPKDKLGVSLMVLLPFVIGPIENTIDNIPATFTANTYIDIAAPAEVIWDNVTRVGTITAEEDKGWLTKFLGFPRPVKAELNYDGVGAYRKAMFTKGLLFHETVTHYEAQKKMVFTIKANPDEIPPNALDKHVVIGGKYFDILTGTYELEKLGENQYRLHLYSKFEMNTHFNFYAGLWGNWIMKDIQNNILQIEKQRAEVIANTL